MYFLQIAYQAKQNFNFVKKDFLSYLKTFKNRINNKCPNKRNGDLKII